MIVFIADGSFCLVWLTLTILAQSMPSGAVHPIMAGRDPAIFFAPCAAVQKDARGEDWSAQPIDRSGEAIETTERPRMTAIGKPPPRHSGASRNPQKPHATTPSFRPLSSFRRKPASIGGCPAVGECQWIPAFAGMTIKGWRRADATDVSLHPSSLLARLGAFR
jgi:hypothetical protein